MTYREQLNKLEELGITPTSIEIGNSCDCIFNFNYSDEEFEKLCRFAERMYVEADVMTTVAVAKCINQLVEDGKTVEEILEMDKWDFIDKASNYLD
mgnify:FL=1